MSSYSNRKSQPVYSHQQAQNSSYLPGSHASGMSKAHHAMDQGQAYSIELDTGLGPITIPVKIDIYRASKVADEKRKRNACASARSRQRRKTKEKEASVTIASLQNDIKKSKDDKEYYISESNFWREPASRLS